MRITTSLVSLAAFSAALVAGSSQAQQAAAVPQSAPVVGKAERVAVHRYGPRPEPQQAGDAAHHARAACSAANGIASGEWLTDKYIQHNPNASSGREGVVFFFTQVMKQPRTAQCDG